MKIKAEELVKKERIVQKGIELLEINIKYPSFSAEGEKSKATKGIRQINSFYEAIAQRCFDYAKDTLLSTASREYDDNPNPRKKFTHRRYIYTLEFKLTRKDGGFLSLILDIGLMQGGRRLKHKRMAQTWDLQHGRLCPILFFANTDKKMKKILKEKDAGFYLREEKAVIFINAVGNSKYREFSLAFRDKKEKKGKD